MDPQERQAVLKQIAALGRDQTRLLLSSGTLSGEHALVAAGWLAEIEAAERVRNDASQAEQTTVARSANRAAWIAAKAAIIAAVIAIATMIITILAWLFPRH